MSTQNNRSQSLAMAASQQAPGNALFLHSLLFVTIMVLWFMLFPARALAQDPGGAARDAQLKEWQTIPQWSWDWAERLRDRTREAFPVEVSLRPTMGYGSRDGRLEQFDMAEPAESGSRPGLFSVLDDGEALLSLLERSSAGEESDYRFGTLLADTLNSSFLSFGSRLEFHVSKHFMPYLGGGVLYGGAASQCGGMRLLENTSPGWQIGMGFNLTESPVRFAVDAMYRGLSFEDGDRGALMRMDEKCPSGFGNFSGYSVSATFSFAF